MPALLEIQIDGRDGEEAAVHAVEPSPMTRQRVPAVFDTGAAFQGGFGKISDLSNHVGDCGQNQGVDQRHMRQELAEIEITERNGGDHGGNGSLPGLLRADHRRQLVLSEATADIVGRGVADPVDHERKEQPVGAHQAQFNSAAQGSKNVDDAENQTSGVGERLGKLGEAQRNRQTTESNNDDKKQFPMPYKKQHQPRGVSEQARLLEALLKNGLENVPADLRENILAFYAEPHERARARQKHWQKTAQELEAFKAGAHSAFAIELRQRLLAPPPKLQSPKADAD